MNILISWKESLKQFLLFGFIQDIKAGKPLKSMWLFIKYSFPFWLIFLVACSLESELGTLYIIVHHFTEIILLFFIFFSVKSVQAKSYYTKWHYLLYALFISFLPFFYGALLNYVIIYFSFILSPEALKTIGSFVFIPFSLVHDNLTSLLPIFYLSFAPVFAILFLSPLTVFFVSFVFDTGISLQNIGKSLSNAIKMLFHNYPVCLILFFLLKISYFMFLAELIEVFVTFIHRGFEKILLPLQANPYLKLLPQIAAKVLAGTVGTYLVCLLAVFVISIFVGFYKNQRKKYPALYS